jgi:hypothetical protein
MIRALLLAAALLTATALSAIAGPASFDDNARILAGLQPSADSPLMPVTEDSNWKSHARYFDDAWAKLDQGQLSKTRAWSAKNLPEHRPVMFYMFSGPDFLYADAFFPKASTYVLSGLEPVGQIPDVGSLPPHTLGRELRELQGDLNSVLSFSFFITKKMKSGLNLGRITGTLPVLYTFLVRSGKTIRNVELVALKPDGTVAPSAHPVSKGESPGVKIEFTAGDGAPTQTLYYFSTDLSDGGVKASGFLTFCDKLGTGDSLIKSASYLMHSGNFSKVRDFLVMHSAALVQDDSGIPLRYLAKGQWDLRPFGNYLGPISIFPGRYQKDMRDLFAKTPATPIDFGIGYRHRQRESNLLLAIRTKAQATP